MRTILAVVALVLPFAPLAAPTARADLKDAQGRTVAKATFEETDEGVRITVDAEGLPPGPHGFHVHETGMCEAPEFKTAGGHFNPGKKQHGHDNPQGAHAGDLPNLTVNPEGKGRAVAVAKGTTLGAGPASLLKERGTALVIHADADDGKTDPAGNAGARIACGVVTRGSTR